MQKLPHAIWESFSSHLGLPWQDYTAGAPPCSKWWTWTDPLPVFQIGTSVLSPKPNGLSTKPSGIIYKPSVLATKPSGVATKLTVLSTEPVVYPLSTVCYPLSRACYPLSPVRYPLSPVGYPLNSVWKGWCQTKLIDLEVTKIKIAPHQRLGINPCRPIFAFLYSFDNAANEMRYELRKLNSIIVIFVCYV